MKLSSKKELLKEATQELKRIRKSVNEAGDDDHSSMVHYFMEKTLLPMMQKSPLPEDVLKRLLSEMMDNVHGMITRNPQMAKNRKLNQVIDTLEKQIHRSINSRTIKSSDDFYEFVNKYANEAIRSLK